MRWIALISDGGVPRWGSCDCDLSPERDIEARWYPAYRVSAARSLENKTDKKCL
jgi:hypothetical protein